MISGLTCGLERRKDANDVHGTERAMCMCTLGQLFIRHRDGLAQMYQCAEVDVASSKIHKLGGSLVPIQSWLHLKHALSTAQQR